MRVLCRGSGRSECALDCCHVQVAILSLNRRGGGKGGGASASWAPYSGAAKGLIMLTNSTAICEIGLDFI